MDIEQAKALIDEKGQKTSKTQTDVRQLKQAIGFLSGAFLRPPVLPQSLEPDSEE